VPRLPRLRSAHLERLRLRSLRRRLRILLDMDVLGLGLDLLMEELPGARPRTLSDHVGACRSACRAW